MADVEADVLDESNTEKRQAARDLIQATVKCVTMKKTCRRETLFFEFESAGGQLLRLIRYKRKIRIVSRYPVTNQYDFHHWLEKAEGWGGEKVDVYIRYHHQYLGQPLPQG
ncbi:hypothetical protein [Motiliproteus coralliicola]|uniref:hypothetical protein n=1 Tax=Motiliproteus coralliicola TaxID=2283196 RepID=UPI001058D676|nr:hypothetical protein [Motiliproteus coralliicola]